MVTILIMSANLAILNIFKIKVYQNKGYEVNYMSMTSPTKFYQVTQIILHMWYVTKI